MSLTEEKARMVAEFQRAPGDTGSSEVQIAIMSTRITSLTEHMKVHKHDYHSRRGLIRLVNERRKLMRYLKARDLERYREVIQKLGIRDRC